MAEQLDMEISKRARELLDKGLSAMERNNFVYAVDMFSAALRLEPRFLKARKLLRATAIKRFKMSGGGPLRRVAAALSGFPLLVAGHVALKFGKAFKALELSEKLILKDPFNLLFIRLLCDAAESASMPEAAIHMLVLSREHYPDNTDLIMRLGKLYTSMDQMNEARECFEKVVQLRPRDTASLRNLKDAMARDSMSRGGWREAGKEGGSYRDLIKDKRQSAALEQEDKIVRTAKGIELLIEEGEARVKDAPSNVTERRALANLYVQAGRFDDAVNLLEEGMKLPGASDQSMAQMAAGVRIKQFDQEITELREAGDVAGAEAVESRKRDFAFENAKSRVKQYPNDLPIRFEYGLLLYEKGELDEAIQQFQMSERNPALRVRSLYQIALCFKEKQQFDMARSQFEAAAEGLSDMGDMKKAVFYELGQVLESIGDVEQALSRYKQIYQVDIRYKDVAAKIEGAYKN